MQMTTRSVLVHDVPGTLGKHLRAMLQCGAILIAEAKLCNNLLLEPDDAIGKFLECLWGLFIWLHVKL